MRLSLVRESVSKVARNYNLENQFNRIMEKVGCSCQPLRAEMELLHDECDRLQKELRQTEPFLRLEALRMQIATTDAKEHGPLDRQAQLAFPFFRVWLFERLSDPEGSFELTTPEAAAQAYAEAWLGGWRPKGG
jgi:hypothetical protein